MRKTRWQIFFGLILIGLSALFYVLHYLIFRDAQHILKYGLGDLAFVFIEVLLVTLIIHQLLGIREKRNRLEKLNMVIGAFFSEAGTKLLTYFSDVDPQLDQIKEGLIVSDRWSDKEFSAVSKTLKSYDYRIDTKKVDFEALKSFLNHRTEFLLRLLENPNLLEHESFTDLLQAVFHLNEELLRRDDLKSLPQSDLAHLGGDVRRAYALLVNEWLDYMKHLKTSYPYLFSLAMRTNPFDEKASAIVRS